MTANEIHDEHAKTCPGSGGDCQGCPCDDCKAHLANKEPDHTSPTYTGHADAEYHIGRERPVTLHLTTRAAEVIVEQFGHLPRESGDDRYQVDHDVFNRLQDILDFVSGAYRPMENER